MKKGLIAVTLAATLAVLGLACSETGGLDLDPGTRCDYLVIPSIQANQTYFDKTEVDCPTDFTLPIQVVVNFLALGGAGPVDPATELSDFLLEKYIVTYRNITQNGANVPRTNVPEGFLVTTSSLLQGFPSTYMLNGAPVLQASAKGQPPLNNDSFFTIGTDPLSGVVLEAELVFWGYPVGQPARECRGTMVYRFTVYDVPSSTADQIATQAAICEAEAGR